MSKYLRKNLRKKFKKKIKEIFKKTVEYRKNLRIISEKCLTSTRTQCTSPQATTKTMANANLLLTFCKNILFFSFQLKSEQIFLPQTVKRIDSYKVETETESQDKNNKVDTFATYRNNQRLFPRSYDTEVPMHRP